VNFDDLQIIWNTQDQHALYTINEAAVEACLWRQRQTLRRSWFRWMILTSYMAAGLWGFVVVVSLFFLSVRGELTGRELALFAAAGAVLVYFLTIIVKDRQQERRREAPLVGSLREELERGIANIEYQIRAGGGSAANRKAILLLVGILLAMWGIVDATATSPWLLVLVAGTVLLGFPVELWRHRRRVNRDLVPKKQALESLLARLKDLPS
jgi:hypothetical protein